MRLGIFGGTFDPIHLGHLLLAEMCREQCELDAVWFMPAAVPPHKQRHGPEATVEQRITMLRLAIGGHQGFEVCDYEATRQEVNYTYATLQWLAAERPDDELFFLMGGDSLVDLPTWRQPQQICELAIPVVVARTGSPKPDWSHVAELVTPERLAQIRHYTVEMPIIGLSSTLIRNRIAQRQSIRYQTTRAVEKYIQSQGLYQPSAEPTPSPAADR